LFSEQVVDQGSLDWAVVVHQLQQHMTRIINSSGYVASNGVW
jgi:hypothetical protein